MLSHRWFIASGFITLLLSGCGGAKSSQEIAKLTKASVILITAYTEQPSTGTGFFIKGEKGVCTVLTARHVVPIGTKVQLQSNDGKPPWEAVNIQRFPNQDLALVTFKSKGENCPYPALELGDSDKVAEGETIYITGFPGGSSTPQFVSGAVSALAKLADGYGISYAVITVGGMSGGPVVNSAGEVIAIHGRSEQELTDKAKLTGENLPPQQQSTKSVNSAEGVAQNTFKWGIPSNTYKANKATAKSDADTAEAKAKEFWNKGNDLLTSKKYEEAIAAYEKAIQYKPNYAEAWAVRGCALGELERYDEAIASFDKAIHFKPDLYDAWAVRGIALAGLKRYEEALTSLDKAIQFKPDDAEAWNNRGGALRELKRYDEAITSYDKAIQFKPDFPEAWNNRGGALAGLERYNEALTALDKAIQFKPDFYEASYNRGNVLRKLKRYDEAITSYDKAIQFKPDFPEAWYNRGVALAGLERYDEAIASFDKAIQFKPDFHEAWTGRGNALVGLKRYDEAIKSYDKAISIQPDFQFAINNRKQLLTQLGRSN